MAYSCPGIVHRFRARQGPGETSSNRCTRGAFLKPLIWSPVSPAPTTGNPLPSFKRGVCAHPNRRQPTEPFGPLPDCVCVNVIVWAGAAQLRHYSQPHGSASGLVAQSLRHWPCGGHLLLAAPAAPRVDIRQRWSSMLCFAC